MLYRGLTGLKSKLAGLFFLDAPGNNLLCVFVCLLQLLEIFHIPLLMTPSSKPSSKPVTTGQGLLPSPMPPSLPLSPTFKDTYGYTGPTWITQATLF